MLLAVEVSPEVRINFLNSRNYGKEKRTLAQMERHQQEVSGNVRKVCNLARLSG